MIEFKTQQEPWEQKFMIEFKTQQECWEALISGKWLSNRRKDFIRHMESGRIVNERGEYVTTCFNDPERWFTYYPAKDSNKEKTKVSEFNTQQELWEALISGKWLTKDGYAIMLVNGNVTDLSGEMADILIDMPHLWSLYVPAKRMIRVAPSLTRTLDGRYYITNALHDSEAKAESFHRPAFVRWLIGTPYEILVEEGI